MADFNQLLASSFADFVRRRFGEDISLSAIAPELVPVLALESDRADWAFLFTELLVSQALVQPLNAGQVSATQLRNPAGSNVVAIVEEIDVSVGNSANDITLGHLLNQADLGTLGPGNVVRDARWVTGGATVNQGVCVCSRANVASANASLILQLSVAANTPLQIRLPLVLTPGATLRVGTGFNNATLNVSYHWRERRIRPEEL